jgi:hypothetical protein
MSKAEEPEFKKLTITLLDKDDRRAVFERSCELLSLNIDKEAAKLNLERKKEGYDVSVMNLVTFCAINSLHGQFDFRTDENLFLINVPVIPSVGKIAIEAPQTIKPTSVDQMVVEQAPVVEAAPIDNPPVKNEQEADSNKNWKSVSMNAPMTEEEAGSKEEKLNLVVPKEPEEDVEQPDPF